MEERLEGIVRSFDSMENSWNRWRGKERKREEEKMAGSLEEKAMRLFIYAGNWREFIIRYWAGLREVQAHVQHEKLLNLIVRIIRDIVRFLLVILKNVLKFGKVHK